MSEQDQDEQVDDELEAHKREAEELAQSGVETRELVCRMVPRLEFLAREVRALADRQASAADATLQLAEGQGLLARDVGRLLAETARLAELVGEPPDPARRRPGSGLYGLVAVLWSEKKGAAVGAVLGGSGAIGLVELAKLIMEAFR